MIINIAGDFVIKEEYLESSLITDSVKNIFNKENINIVNLECPIIKDNFKSIVKSGPNLYTKTGIIKALTKIKH